MNLLFTSVGRRRYILQYFKQALGNKGKIVATNAVFTNSLLAGDHYEISPLIHDPAYIPFILGLCRRHAIRAVISLFDIDLPVLAANAEALRKVGAEFIGPDHRTALIGNDKLLTQEFFEQRRILTPQTCSSLPSALRLIDTGDLAFPVIVKPRFGMGSIGIFKAGNLAELEILYAKCRSEVFSTYLRFESIAEPENAVLIQQLIEGQEHGLDIFKDLDGNLVGLAAKKKVTMRSGETDIGEVVDPSPFQPAAASIAAGLGFSGLLSVDCFVSDKGIFYTEINPRISGHYPYSHLAGVRYPEQLVAWLEGASTNPDWLSARVGLRGSKELVPELLRDG